jgi:hypothetical protein
LVQERLKGVVVVSVNDGDAVGRISQLSRQAHAGKSDTHNHNIQSVHRTFLTPILEQRPFRT